MLARVLALLALAAIQEAGVLRVRVTIDGTPVPRVVLLVSDNPSTVEPRRVRTGPDGTVELKLTPGLYTVESDQPIAVGGRAFNWTQMITVRTAQSSMLELTAANADVESSNGATASTGLALLTQWQDSVVELWTATTHASGFVVDARSGLITTSHHALRGATALEVELRAGAERTKIAGAVLLSERLTGAAIVRVDPAVLSAVRPIETGCATNEHPSPAHKEELTALASPMFAPKSLSGGTVTKITSQAIFTDMTLARDSAGSPVFANDGQLVGIGAFEEGVDQFRRWSEAWVVPAAKLCEAVSAVQPKLAAAPPQSTPLPIESAVSQKPILGTTKSAVTGSKQQPATMSSADFDISLLTTMQVQAGTLPDSPRSDFMNWSDYVREAPPALLIRVSPKFEESLWKTLARGAAATQGMALPPLKSFNSNFLRMRASCGDTDILPIHPLIIERQISEKVFIREGLYVFPIDAFGAHCTTVRLAMYSEKDPQKADVKTIEPQLFDRISSQAQH